MSIILLAAAVVLFLLAALNDFGWVTISHASALVLIGLACFAASFLPWSTR